MSIRLTPPLKGLIIGLLMIAAVLGVYYSGQPSDSPIQYLIYIIYILGITWTLFIYRQSHSFTGKFGDLFMQGFRCFIMVALIMVVFTGVFSKMHPEFADEMAKAYKEELLTKNDKTPPEIESEVATFKKQYTIRIVSASIFGYLIIGAGATAVLSVLLTRRK
jgi:hypothetical protein